MKETLHGDTVIYECLTQIHDFRRRLDSLLQNHRRLPEHYLRRLIILTYILIYIMIQCRWVYKKHSAIRLASEIGQADEHVIIIHYLHLVLTEFMETLPCIGIHIRRRRLLHKPSDIVMRNKQIRNDQRIVVNVAAAYIQHPCYLIQRSQENLVISSKQHPFAKPLYLVDAGNATEAVHIQCSYRSNRYLRPVLPQGAQHVRHIYHRALFTQCVRYLLHGSRTLAKSVHSYHGSILEKPLRNTYRIRYPCLMQFYACSFQLSEGLYEIAGICP